MGQVALNLVFETDTMEEVCSDLVRVLQTLTELCAGPVAPRYMTLLADVSREAEKVMERPVEIRDLGEGFHVYVPPPELAALLRRARRLKLIR